MEIPLVTIGIPTFNREVSLQRAVASALAQDYPNIEVVISDNGSVDGTEAFCRELAGAEARVRYQRNPTNQGMVANFIAALAAASGSYFMWLADDDVLAPNYVSECVAVLEDDASTVLAAGRPYLTTGGVMIEEDPVTLISESGFARVLAYYRCVLFNSVFSGVARTESLRAVPAFRNVTGGDWIFIASLAFCGKVRTIESTTITCSAEGMSGDLRAAAGAMRLTRFAKRLPHTAVSMNVAVDLIRSPVYGRLSNWERLHLSARSSLAVAWRVGVLPKLRTRKKRILRQLAALRFARIINRTIRSAMGRADGDAGPGHRGGGEGSTAN